MSKQSEARIKQGHTTESPKCSNCLFFRFDVAPIPWMVKSNERDVKNGCRPSYNLNLAANQKEKNLRCAIGGFAVKKQDYCDEYSKCDRS